MIRNTIYQDLITARKERKQHKTAILIMLWSKIQLKEKELKISELSDVDTIAIIKNELKQTKETLEGFKKRNDDKNIEVQEYYITVLEAYLPQQLTKQEIRHQIISSIVSSDKTYSNFGELMRDIMQLFKGVADGKIVKEIAEEEFKIYKEMKGS